MKRLVTHKQADQYKNSGSARRRREKGVERIFEELLTKNIKFEEINIWISIQET